MTVADQDVHRCGHNLSRSTNPAMVDGYEVDAEVVCYACAAEAEFRRERKDLPNGAVVRVADTWPDDEDLPPWQPGPVGG